MISIRLRSRIGKQELDEKVGRVVGDDAYNLRLTGSATVLLPDGRPLCVYLPGAMSDVVTPDQYEILHALRFVRTDNRGKAGATRRVRVGAQKRTYAKHLASSLIGAMDNTKTSQFKFCRLTAWTGRHLPEWQALQPPLSRVAELMSEYVPDRYSAQMREINRTHPDWVVPGTPFTTVTVNNTYPTGVHTDKGDLDKGYSTIFCLRRGEYTGGVFVFPEYRIAVDLQDGDLILMDAHQWHGNTPITCACGKILTSCCEVCGAERISVVSYMRTAMVDCGSEVEENRRAMEVRERTKGITR